VVLGLFAGAGCAPLPDSPVSTTGRIARADLHRVKKGMSEESVLAICKEPLARQAPSQAAIHEMWPGSEWDSVWTYSGETVPGQYARGSVRIFFLGGKVQSWSFPFITKDQYVDIINSVNARKVTTAVALEAAWGWPAKLIRMPGGGVQASYHLVQLDGTVYGSAITALYAGGNIYSVSLENLQH
jgi:hypothetical protein